MSRASGLAVSFGLVAALVVPATAPAAAAAPAGDVSSSTAPRPPLDLGDGRPVARSMFSNPDGTIACRRVYTEMVWLECLLKRTQEIVQFGPDESWVDVPCTKPNEDQTCRLSFGAVYISRASRKQAARFAGARRVPLEQLIDLGRRTVPYPACIADPHLGLSCTTLMDDSVGEQIYFGLAGSIWNCPGYEYSPGETPIPQGGDVCRVVRP